MGRVDQREKRAGVRVDHEKEEKKESSEKKSVG